MRAFKLSLQRKNQSTLCREHRERNKKENKNTLFTKKLYIIYNSRIINSSEEGSWKIISNIIKKKHKIIIIFLWFALFIFYCILTTPKSIK